MCVRLTIIVFFIGHHLLAQPRQLDSLQAKLRQYTKNDTIRVRLLNALSTSAWGADPAQAKTYAEQALALAQELKYIRGVAEAYKEISRYYWSQTEYDKSTDYALMAIKEYERCHDLTGISWCFATIGSNYSQANDYDKANYYHHRALELNKRINNQSGVSRNLNSLGYVCELKKDYHQALEYYKQALQMRITLGDKTDLTLSYSNVGSIYYFLEQYPLALEYLFKALPLAQEINNKNYLALTYQNIGEVYYKTGKYNDGEFYLTKALGIANEIGDKKRREGVYEALKNLEKSRGNFKKAYDYLEHLQNIRDTLYTQDRSKQMARMETLFETEKKEQTIKLLGQEHRIQTIWRNVLTLGIILVGFVTVVIYRLQRSRTQKANELLEFQQSLNDKLREIDRLKSRFFANISHEFRTPLTLLLAPLEEKLKAADLAKSERESLLLMRRNANRLFELVNQLLDLSKLEAGKMFLKVGEGNLKGFLKVLLLSFDSLADSRKIDFKKEIDLPQEQYWYDADVMEKILHNLLSNAFKFTPPNGSVTVFIQTDIVSQKDLWLLIQVADTGKGIPTEEQGEIFSPFYQAKNTAQDGLIGTGLGLSLVKELVKLYEGSVELASEENKGTTITIRIPAGKEQLKTYIQVAVPKNESRISPYSNDDEEYTNDDSVRPTENAEIILVVEDNVDLRNFIASLLQPDFTVMTAVNGQEGVDMALEHVPSLIISDLMMPELDGIGLTEKIKSDERTSHIPVILLTAKNEHESRLEGLKTGADDYLTKPFSTEELVIRANNLIEQRKKLATKYSERFTILPSLSRESSMDEKFLLKIKVITEVNLCDFDFGVEKLAEEAHLSRTQLLRKLKALTGLSPSEFIKDMRLKKAAELICSKTDTITQIGYAVGFNDQSYFTKCFKKQFGVSPSEYSAKFNNA